MSKLTHRMNIRIIFFKLINEDILFKEKDERGNVKSKTLNYKPIDNKPIDNQSYEISQEKKKNKL